MIPVRRPPRRPSNPVPGFDDDEEQVGHEVETTGDVAGGAETGSGRDAEAPGERTQVIPRQMVYPLDDEKTQVIKPPPDGPNPT